MEKLKTRQQIANEYGVSRRTLYNMLERGGVQLTKGYITPREQQKIYQELGPPPNQNSSRN